MLAQAQNVNSPLTAAGRWWTVVDKISEGTKSTASLALQAVVVVGTVIGLLTGYISVGATNQHDLGTLKSQITDLRSDMAVAVSSLRTDISKLNDRVEQGPRADQLQEILRHMSAQDGRMDSYDVRMRTLETQQAGMAARLEAIDAASRLQLPRK